MGKDKNGKELGSGICQRLDGKYCGRFTDRFGVRRSIYSENLKQLKDEYGKAVYEDKNQMNLVDDRTTLNEFFKKWIDIHKYKIIRDSTRTTYTGVYEKHIKPTLGKCRLRQISQLQIRGLIKELSEKGYGFETQNKVKIMLVDIFNKALIDNFVQKNPARDIKVVRDEEKDIRVLTQEEQSTFFECCKGTFYDNLFTVAVATGLRPGELFALTWEDIDFEKKEIHVNKTLLYQKLLGDTGKEFSYSAP